LCPGRPSDRRTGLARRLAAIARVGQDDWTEAAFSGTVMKQARLLSLDALRGVAAIVVLIHHAERELHFSAGFAYGYLAVDIFFLMSGFVIASAYEPRMDARMGLWALLKMRLIRFYPMILLGALLGIGVALRHWNGEAPLLLAGASALLMLPLVWTGSLLFPVNIPEWSIFFELVVNLFHRLTVSWLGTRALVAIIALAFVLLGVAGWRLRGLANGFSPETFWGGFPRVFFSYFMGVLIYRTSLRWRSFVPSLPLPLLLLGFLAVVVGEALLGGRVPASAYWLGAVMLAVPTGLMLLAQAHVPVAMTRIAEALGDLSYPLYAIHMPLLLLIAPSILPLSPGIRAGAAIPVAVVIVSVAWLLDRRYDRVVRRLMQGRRRSPVPMAEAEIAAP
jgi:peptidoglycan/LPS O-acetylase OafA/YrhL